MTITWIESRGDCSTGISNVMRGLSSLIVATMRAMPQINVELGIRNEELFTPSALLVPLRQGDNKLRIGS